MTDDDLKPDIGKQTELDIIVGEVMSRPLNKEELRGFGRKRPKLPKVYPYVKYRAPSKTDGPKGHTIEIGIKGEF